MLIKVELTLDNVVSVYEFVNELNLNEKEECLMFLDLNAANLVSNHDLFCQLPYRIVRELVKRDTFFVTELQLFQALWEWSQRNNDYLIDDLFNDFRWNLLKPQEFGKYVRSKNVIPYDTYFESFNNPKPQRVPPPDMQLTTNGEFNSSIGASPLKTQKQLLCNVNNEQLLFISRTPPPPQSPSSTMNAITSPAPACDPDFEIIASTSTAQRRERRASDEELNLVNLALSLCQSETITRAENSERAVELILKLIENRVKTSNSDYLLFECFTALRSLLSESTCRLQENCDKFFMVHGVQCFITCIQACGDKDGFLSEIFVILRNIIEMNQSHYLSALTCDEILNKCTELASDDKVTFSLRFLATYVVLNLCQDRLFKDGVSPFDKDILDNICEAITKWDLKSDVDIDDSSNVVYKSINMALTNNNDVYKVFALWTTAYFLKTNPVEHIDDVDRYDIEVNIHNKLDNNEDPVIRSFSEQIFAVIVDIFKQNSSDTETTEKRKPSNTEKAEKKSPKKRKLNTKQKV